MRKIQIKGVFLGAGSIAPRTLTFPVWDLLPVITPAYCTVVMKRRVLVIVKGYLRGEIL